MEVGSETIVGLVYSMQQASSFQVKALIVSLEGGLSDEGHEGLSLETSTLVASDTQARQSYNIWTYVFDQSQLDATLIMP